MIFLDNYAAFDGWNGKRNVNVNRNGNDWNDNWLLAGVRNLLHFSLYLNKLGEFSFSNFPCQPPNILPTSSNFKDNSLYFLVSISLFSQPTNKSIFIVSNFLIANFRNGNLSCLFKKTDADTASNNSTNKTSIFRPKECLCGFGISL